MKKLLLMPIVLVLWFLSCQKNSMHELNILNDHQIDDKLSLAAASSPVISWNQLPFNLRNASNVTLTSKVSSFKRFVGPYPGNGSSGTAFSIDPPDDHSRIYAVGINHNYAAILGIAVWYITLDNKLHLSKGGNTSNVSMLYFANDEYLKGILVRAGSVVNGLSFITNSRQTDYGSTVGTLHTIRAPTGFLILGFSGSSYTVINQIGADIHCKFWRKISGYAGKDIAVDVNGTAYLTSADGGIYSRTYSATQWTKIAGSGGVRIAANNNRICLVNSNSAIYEYNFTRWAPLSSPGISVRDIAVNSDKKIWIVTGDGKIRRFNETGWDVMNGNNALKIAAGANQVWLVTTDRRIWKYNGSSWNPMPGGNANDIAVSDDGIAWYNDTSGRIYIWNGSSWEQICGYAGFAIAANKRMVMLINPYPTGTIHRLTY
jgi:hypothetical protein